jgi:hypothetical protein
MKKTKLLCAALTVVMLLTACSGSNSSAAEKVIGTTDKVVAADTLKPLAKADKEKLGYQLDMPEKGEEICVLTTNYGTIRIDVSRHTVQVDGNEVELTYKEYEILKYLMKNRGIVLTRDSLMEKIWGYDFEHGNRTVDVHIQSLRKKLGTAGDAIKTIRNVGYKIGD